RVTRYASAFDRLVEAAKKLTRGGKPLLEDPVVRAKLGKIYAEMEVQRYAALRVLSALQKGDSPGAASSITKLSYSEFEKRYYELALEILGPYGQITDGGLEETTLDVDSSSGVRSSWAYAFLWARAGTICSGSSEIQKNVIGERVLGLPKEIRADRVAKAEEGIVDFSFSSDQQLLRNSVRAFLDEHSKPAQVRLLWDDPRGESEALWKEM